MPIKFANNAETTLSSAVSTSATSIPVVDASVFPSITGSDYFLVTLVDSGDNTEIVKVTAVSSNTLTVTRAREGTAARSFASGDKVENRLTAGGLTDLNTRTDLDVDTMTGDGSTTTLTLSTAPATEDNTMVYLDGVYQNKSTYSVSGTTLTFSTAPPNNVAVEVIIITPAAGTFSSSDYATSSQGNKADNALPRSGGAMTGAITTSSTFDGRNVSADGIKLDGIETGATADQTASEIKTAYESNSDTNAFTDSEKTKLNNIEANATADQSDEEIQDIVGAMVSGNTESGIGVTYDDTSGKLNFAVASQTDENFTSADRSKLDSIESGATTDQTATEIKTAYESNSDTNAFSDSEKSKLSGIETSADVTDTANVVSSLTSGTNINIANDGTIGTTTTQAITASSLESSSDNTVDIGTSSARFKDIYLSGGVYIGGTGSSNLLNDYEQGTWTPTVYASNGTSTLTSGTHYVLRDASYTKIGRLVFISIKIEDIRSAKTNIWFTPPFNSAVTDTNVGSTLGAEISGQSIQAPIYALANKFQMRKGTWQYAYGSATYQT